MAKRTFFKYTTQRLGMLVAALFLFQLILQFSSVFMHKSKTLVAMQFFNFGDWMRGWGGNREFYSLEEAHQWMKSQVC